MSVAWAGFWPIGRPCKTLRFFAEIALDGVDAVAFSPEAQGASAGFVLCAFGRGHVGQCRVLSDA